LFVLLLLAMPEILLELFGVIPPEFFVLLLPLTIWGLIVRETLSKREDKPESYQQALQWLREEQFGLFYLKALGWLLDKVADWLGDKHQLQTLIPVEQRRGWVEKSFGLNPFTPQAYEKCLKLAFLYPLLGFLLAWALGGQAH
jgi:hypothetical protein